MIDGFFEPLDLDVVGGTSVMIKEWPGTEPVITAMGCE